MFPLAAETFSIGRTVANDLSVLDPSVSRKHCLITPSAGGFLLRDVGSRNGTFVNGLPLQERLLQPGDEIQVGKSVFVFGLDDGDAPAISPADFGDRPSAMATVTLQREDALRLDSPQVAELMSRWPGVAEHFTALMKIIVAVSSIRGLVALGRPLLELIGDIFPADRAAIFFVDARAREATSVVGWDRQSGFNESPSIDRAMFERVIRDGSAILSDDASEGDHRTVSPDLPSPTRSPTRRSILAAPMIAFDRVLGVLYLEGGGAPAAFDKGHLHLLTAIAGVASMAIDHARQVEWLESENRRLEAEVSAEHNMVGNSAKMRKVYQFITKSAPTTANVLIRGESGTGKELVARAIHRNGNRAGKPFAAINCAALTETLLESELFGYEKGAFTGAAALKRGKLEIADGGTVFLDEVGELPLSIQAKLLRVLQEREFERVGGTRPIKVDIRLIAATNRDLEEAMRANAFRSDLYYRLNVVSLTLPPLRVRREDIVPLATFFTSKYAERCNRHVGGLSEEAQACLIHYDWPGNVRELENVIERAVVLGSSSLIRPEDLGDSILESESASASTRFHDAIRLAKKDVIVAAFKHAGGSHAEAARLLALHPNYLHRLIRHLNLKSELGK